MARGTTLLNLRAMLNAELGNSTAANAARDAQLNVLLSNKQKWLATEMQWPFLERRWDVVVPAGQQYTGFPTMDDEGDTTAINLEVIPEVEVKWTTKFEKVAYGISSKEYNTLDFALAQQSDPIQRWRMASNVDELSHPNQFEVWPVPVTAQTVRFTGQRTVLPLVGDADVADLDDILLVLLVAADMLTRTKQADAMLKTQLANRRLQYVKQNYPSREERRYLGGMKNSGNKPRTAGMIILTK